MIWLLLDDPKEHNVSMHENMSAGLRLYQQEVKVVFELEEALTLMMSIPFDYVMIHHYDFVKVDTLRNRFPNSKYVANSADIFSFNYSGSVGEHFNKKLLEHYSLIAPSNDLEGFLQRETGLKRPFAS
jgi:hypothetical protein